MQPIDINEVVDSGAIIIDVRTKEEYRTGHIEGSLNIPLPELTVPVIAKFDKDIPVITCCASGMRSASAKNILLSQGFTQVYNGGGWHSLKNRIAKA